MGVLAHWKQGHKTEAILIEKLSELGYEVLKPLNGSLRYDLVIEDDNGQFWRIQCKTAWIEKRSGVLRFHTASTGGAATRANNRQGYKGQIDYFAVYAPDLKECFLIPIDHAKGTEMRLRLEPTKNNQKKGINYAYDYLLQ
ncbi:MAG TPA: group I intron-associated PD-(D/E)XK endonuclease [Ktedonobacteraceae bacterium]|nr:group I intron-associated PD-(D/E)XK endonuclease [Ktedonobacteraceae bacterium]